MPPPVLPVLLTCSVALFPRVLSLAGCTVLFSNCTAKPELNGKYVIVEGSKSKLKTKTKNGSKKESDTAAATADGNASAQGVMGETPRYVKKDLQGSTVYLFYGALKKRRGWWLSAKMNAKKSAIGETIMAALSMLQQRVPLAPRSELGTARIALWCSLSACTISVFQCCSLSTCSVSLYGLWPVIHVVVLFTRILCM